MQISRKPRGMGHRESCVSFDEINASFPDVLQTSYTHRTMEWVVVQIQEDDGRDRDVDSSSSSNPPWWFQHNKKKTTTTTTNHPKDESQTRSPAVD
jgi:hypothetical protein